MGWGTLVGAWQAHTYLLGGAVGGKAGMKKGQEGPSESGEGKNGYRKAQMERQVRAACQVHLP